MMKWNIEKKEDKLFVTLTVEHIRTQRRWTNTSYTSADVLEYLQEQNVAVDKMIQDDIVHNYQRESNLTGTWVFSLPSKPKAKKTTKAVEKKESVIKINTKKTIKK